jgi:hypothetical protein
VVAVLEEEEHRGPVETDTKATETREEHAVERLDLKLRRRRRPGRSGSGSRTSSGLARSASAVRYRLGGLGPCVNLWAEGSIRPRIDRPLESPIGAGLACDVR